MTKDEALKIALQALKTIDEAMPFPVAKLAQAAIKEALAQSDQEPVVCVEYIPCCIDQTCPKCKAAIKPELVCVCGAVWEGQELIYTPPQRTWVGLTDEEIDDLSRTMVKGNKSVNWLCQAIEAKLKEKNT